MTQHALIVGGGIAGLAAALACSRAGWRASVLEQAPQFSEAGAGIQLGPNATRILQRWGLGPALAEIAALPERLVVRSARDGAQLGALRLGRSFEQRYGAPYAAVHRADLQGLLLQSAREAGARLCLSSPAEAVVASIDSVALRVEGDREVEGDALLGADGLWSSVRNELLHDGAPVFTGHLAYRALLAQRDLPASLRSQDVSVWLGPAMHLVAYPVKRGEQLNVVVLVEGTTSAAAARDWDQPAVAAQLHRTTGALCDPLQQLLHAVPAWRLWALNDRAPVAGADQMARGRIALLGDAAHPMLPYFAQGAGMALEDAAVLEQVLGQDGADVPAALRRYAQQRWQRSARVQALSRRNGRIFHAAGVVRRGRDLALRLLGERLLDQPWLYRG